MVLKIIPTDTSALPQDRESVFFLNVKEIPPRADTENVLQIAIRTRIKMFYRPAQLAGEVETAAAQLQWQVLRDDAGALQLQVQNPSAYAVTVVDASADGVALRNDMVLPQQSLRYALPAHTGASVEVTFSSMNDFGGTSVPLKVRAQRAATAP